MVKEFTDFPDVGPFQTGDLPVGTRAGQNAQFDFPGAGIQDESGNFLLGWQTVGVSAVNYIQSINAVSGAAPGFVPDGIDANIGISFTPKGMGGIEFNTAGAANFAYVNSGMGNVTLEFGGYFALNGTQGVSSISNDNTLSTNSASILPTQQAVKGYIGAASAPINASYITGADETATLPNSLQLLGTANQITVTNGALSLSSTLITPGSVTLGGNLNVGTSRIVSPSGSAIELVPNVDADGIDLSSTIIRVEQDLRHAGDETNKVSFTTAAQTFYIGGVSQIDLSSAGLRVGTTGARINNIDNTGTSFLSTDSMTAMGIQMAIATQIDAGVSFRGGWDASGGTYPTTGGTGIAGAVENGNWWYITVAGTLSGTAVQIGDSITALVNVPGQTGSNWLILREGVNSVFGRTGPVVAVSGDYSFPQISGTAAVAQGGTGATSIGASGTLAQSTGSVWGSTTATYPATIAINSILYGSAANVISGLTPVGSSVLVTSASGIPFLPPAMTNGQIIIGSTLDVPLPGNITSGTGIAVTNGSHSITIGLSTPVSAANGGTGNISGQAASVANAATFNNAGSGAASGSTFDGSVARTISYNTVGASPLAGSSSIVTVGTIASGIWQGTAVGVTKGGTGLTSTAINQILYSSATSTIAGLATANRAMLVTGATGVPAMTASMTNGQIVVGSSSGAAAPAALGVGPNLTTAVGANSLTINTNFSYGYIWMNTGNWTGISFSALTTYSELSGLTTAYVLASPVQDFSMATNGQLQYTGTVSKTLLVSANVGFNPVSSGYSIQLFKNGIALPGSECYETGPTSLAVIDFPVTVVTNDYISIFLKRSAAGTAPITQIGLSISSIA